MPISEECKEKWLETAHLVPMSNMIRDFLTKKDTASAHPLAQTLQREISRLTFPGTIRGMLDEAVADIAKDKPIEAGLQMSNFQEELFWDILSRVVVCECKRE